MILKRLVLFCGVYWIPISVIFCQKQPFSILGMIKEPASWLVSIHTINSKTTLTIDTTILSNNSFTFNGYIDHPEMIFLRLNDSIESNTFFLDPGLQTLNIKIKDNQIVLISNSKSNVEKSHFKSFEDSLKLVNIHNINYLDESEYYLKVDSFLFSFVKNNRDSYFGLYNLSSNIPWYGLKNIYLKTFNLFSNKLKKSTLGKETLSEIKIANKLAIDQYFPSSLVYTIDETKVLLSTYFKNNKYTLIDIWSSTCPPCIQQFEELNRVYSKYKPLKFEIIGISNDTRKYKKELISAIAENHLQWPQLWDIDESLRKKYHILSVPRSYLLNKKGKIVLANFDLADLNIYLDKHLLH